jgi:hypothetical protein
MGNLVNPSPAVVILEAQRHSKMALSLTNLGNDNEPKIIGIVEVAGALYEFSTEEAIAGWSGIGNNTDCWIKLVPQVDDTIDAEYTTTAPAWDRTKQGWYGTGASANHRYVGGLHRGASSSNYEGKWLYKPAGYDRFTRRFLHESIQRDEFFAIMDPWISTVGDKMEINGAIGDLDSGYTWVVSAIERTASTEMTIWCVTVIPTLPSNAPRVITSSETDDLVISISW